jgi:hypothetical protein
VADVRRGQAWRADFKHEWEFLWQGSLHKWWVDELYEAVLIRPIVWVSRNVLVRDHRRPRDRRARERHGRGLKKVAAWNGRTIQGGRVQSYALVIASGTACCSSRTRSGADMGNPDRDHVPAARRAPSAAS